MKKIDISIVVPCYNEEKNVELFYNETTKLFDSTNYSYEIIFVNDGSSDNTYNKLKEITEKTGKNIKVVNFSRNFGKEAAMYAGLKETIGDNVSIIDADMQQDPKYILDMLNYLNEHNEYDAVAAYQEKRKESSVLTFFKNTFYKLINKISDTNFTQGASDFRTFRRNVVEAILSLGEYYRFSKGIFSWVGFNTYYMPYEVKERAHGSSTWSFWKLFKYAVEGIVAFTTAPLRIATFIGMFTAICSIIYLIIVVIQKLVFGIMIPGYATIVTLILFLGGMQLFSIGIIGEYLARLYIENKRRPIYIAKNIIDYNNKNNNRGE